ncbi:MAG: MoaD/ThiS family protein [Pseudonocardiaceae bacterium]
MTPMAQGIRVRNVRLTGGKPVLRRAFEQTLGYAPAPFFQGDDQCASAMGGATVVTVRYFAAARAAAGLPSEDVDIGDGATVADALETIASRHGDALRKVLAACSFLLDSVAVRDRATPLRPGAELDVLPPFAGG